MNPSLIVVGFMWTMVIGSAGEGCPKFTDIPDLQNYNCTKACLQPEGSNVLVFGTDYYHEESKVCLAALHAGAVGADGGRVTFSSDTSDHDKRGTIRNRVVSKLWSADGLTSFKFEKTSPVISKEDLAEDVVIVHNAYSRNKLELTCLAENINRQLTKEDVNLWNYKQYKSRKMKTFREMFTEENHQCIFPFEFGEKTYWQCTEVRANKPWCIFGTGFRDWDYCSSDRDPGRWGIYIYTGRKNNERAFRCLGRTAATDVLAIVQTSDQKYVAKTNTIRVSIGDYLQVPIQRVSETFPSEVFLCRLPDDCSFSINSHDDTLLPLTFNQIRPGDAGIYFLGNTLPSEEESPEFGSAVKKYVQYNGAYFHLIVRECASGRYGPDCQSYCPDCENGGICHAATGSCICAPGYYGPTCQEACTKGLFGTRCHLKCSKITLGFNPERMDDCFGLVLCVPEPYGCSCAPGYLGPFCNEACSVGTYGAECSQRCDYCEDKQCDSISGKCSHGCLNNIPCEDGMPLDLPRLRTPLSLSDIQKTSVVVSFSSWTKDKDDGSDKFAIVSHIIQFQREDSEIWKDAMVSSMDSSSNLVKAERVEHLAPGYQYWMRVVVSTVNGTADGSTNKRIHNVSLTTKCFGPMVDDLIVSEITNQSAHLNWKDWKNHARCGIQYVVQLIDNLGKYLLNKTTYEHTLHLRNLNPDTFYDVRVIARNNETVVSSVKNFTTYPNAPSQPIVVVSAEVVGHLSVSWKLPRDSTHADTFGIRYKLLQYKACNATVSSADEHNMTTVYSTTELANLESYALYRVCVIAINTGGESQLNCPVAHTLPDIPSVNVENFSCTSSEPHGATCVADLVGGCEGYNGPDFQIKVHVYTYLKCDNRSYYSNVKSYIQGNSVSAKFLKGLVPGMTHNATLSIINDVDTGISVNTSFKTAEKKPPQVRNLTAYALSSHKVRLLWNDPCPSHGEITQLDYMQKNAIWESIEAMKCKAAQKYDRCVDIEGLAANKEYTFQVAAHNGAGRGGLSEITVITKEAKPGPPKELIATRHPTALDFTLYLSIMAVSTLLNCTVLLQNTEHKCTKLLKQEIPDLLTCKISGVEQGKRFIAEAFCCNSAGCGDPLFRVVATLPAVPELKGDLQVKAKTNTNVTLSLPSIVMNGDGVRSVAILVQHLTKDKSVIDNFTTVYLALHNKSVEKRSARQAGDQQCTESKSTYIAAVMLQAIDEFVVGDGQTYGIFQNCPLKTSETYMMAVVAEINLEGESRNAERKLKEAVKVEMDGFTTLPIVLTILAVLLFLLVILGVIYYKKYRNPKTSAGVKFCKADQMMVTYNDSKLPNEQHNQPIPHILTTPATPQGLSQTMSEDQNIPVYENVFNDDSEDNIYENLSRRIPLHQVEAYLNKTITAKDTMDEFMSVPSNVGKSMTDGEHPENKKKNRYRNNLPYDDTRVRLSIVNDDPFTDYINANHVYGFGGDFNYIASQGPKDTNVNTIGDFWRMICEQHINIIIMVANFVEGGKKKVGEYLRIGTSLEIENFTVEVVKTDNHSHYNVSLVQVWKNGVAHSVTHYHYISWPDHGVPSEAHSLGTMLRQVIQSHSQGSMIVHCSAGIGRTGTVLLVLLLRDMLMVEGSMDPQEVLQRLRECRARLVENVPQYNLGLQIFDELLFGTNTVIPSVNLQDQIGDCLKKSYTLYKKAKTLPSGLTFHSASQSDFKNQNRNPAFLPADTRRVFLGMEGGDPLSQYINAVSLDGLDHPNTMIVTEHPVPATLTKFWRLVVEKKCPNVVLINTYEGYEEGQYGCALRSSISKVVDHRLIVEICALFQVLSERVTKINVVLYNTLEFQTILPAHGTDLVMDHYTVRILNVTQYDSLFIYTIEVFSQKDVHHVLTVYEITSWPYGKEVPSSLDVLLGVSEMLLQTPHDPETGPVLLCCGNGVTGCGIMAGVILTVERLQKYKEVDVYRTVLHLLRVQPQFFTSQAQFDLLYNAAVLYMENNDTYINFPL